MGTPTGCCALGTDDAHSIRPQNTEGAVQTGTTAGAAIGASPSRQEERDIAAWTEALTMVLNPALRSFSVGVRSYYFTVAAAFWFLGPIPFAMATVLGVGLLIWRQSWSDTAKGIMAIRKLLD